METNSIKEVRDFWENNPLFTGEAVYDTGTREWYEEHERILMHDIYGCQVKKIYYNHLQDNKKIMDIGCGPGFWTRFLAKRNMKVFGIDITHNASLLTKKSLDLFDLKANICQGNSERLPVKSNSLDYINCQGVIHHTPDINSCISEFSRILKPGGIVCFSVYHKNFILKNNFFFNLTKKIFSGFVGLKGRGRNNMLQTANNADDLVRLYDGEYNPIGKSYTLKQLKELLKKNNFKFSKYSFDYFPIRAFKLPVPNFIKRLLNHYLGLMIIIKAINNK